MPISVKEIAWLAGLLEGEGCFRFDATPTLTCDSTDEDVIERVCGLFGVSQGKSYNPRYAGAKRVYRARLCGKRAIAWMQTIYVLMGRRRQEAIKEILIKWNAKTRRPRGPLTETPMAECHPDRRHQGHGLCKDCYMKAWRKKNLEHRRAYRNEYMRGWRARKKEQV